MLNFCPEESEPCQLTMQIDQIGHSSAWLLGLPAKVGHTGELGALALVYILLYFLLISVYIIYIYLKNTSIDDFLSYLYIRTIQRLSKG